MTECIFCKIASGEIPSNKVYEDEWVYAFYDLEPQAPVHVLVIPKLHIPSLDAVEEEHQSMLGHLMLSIKDIAAGLDLENGYRIVVNVGEDGMQTVRHLHVHLLGKRRMQWPPG
ncbi:MAG: histidine triad nucleotide-binding protein [Anaerovoracaceae bacterium]|jgi:diadenosine tetraphosphate (Ap4A) HIT family hydrolase